MVTSKAKNAIRHYFRDQRKEDLIQLGWRIVNKACLALGIELPKVETKLLEQAAQSYLEVSLPELLENIALGRGAATEFAQHLHNTLQNNLSQGHSRQTQSDEKPSPLVITGHENLAINYGECCCPIPGDAITGVLVAGEGVYVHRRKCKLLKTQQLSDQFQPIDVEWGDAIRQSFSAQLELYTLNQKGTLAEIAVVVARGSGDIADVKISTRDENTACMSITLVVNDRNQLSRIVRSLRRERCILHVRRTVGEKKEQK